MASCAICDNPAQFRCSRCKVERYCSRECQKDHWPHHKTRCAQLAAAARAGTGDRPSTVGAAESMAQRMQPRPPAMPSQPQAPIQPASLDSSAPFRGGNPRTARLLGDLPPRLQPDSEQAAGSSTLQISIPAAAGVGVGVGARISGAATTAGSSAGSSMSRPVGCSDSVDAGVAGTSGSSTGGSGCGGSGGGGDAPLWTTQPSSPAHQLSQQAPVRSPHGPRTPLSLQPAPPPGSPHTPSGRASIRAVRSHWRESSCAAVGVELQVEGSGLIRNGSASGPSGGGGGGGGSILDRIMPPPAPSTPRRAPPDDGGTIAGRDPAETSAAFQQQQHSDSSAPREPVLAKVEEALPQSVDTVFSGPMADMYDGDTGTASTTPHQGYQQAPQLPWAERSANHAFDAEAAGGKLSSASLETSCLSDVPGEVLLEVFKALPARSLAAAVAVCRSWRRAAREPWLWVRQLCAAGYPLPAAAYVVRPNATPTAAAPSSLELKTATAATAAGDTVGAAEAGEEMAEDALAEALRAVPGVRGIRAVRAVRAAGGCSHEDFLGGLRVGFLDRLQQQQQQQGQKQGNPKELQQQHQQQHQQRQHSQSQQAQQQHLQPQHGGTDAAVDLKGLYGRIVRMESNWRTARFAEMPLREHSSNVECLAFQRVEPWGSVLLSAAWDGSVRVFSLGPASGAPQQARCVRRYRGHTGWITCMAAGRHQVVTASTDRRVAAWRYYSESSDPWVALEHPQEVTLVRFCYAPPPPATTHYLAHHLCYPDWLEVAGGGCGTTNGGGAGGGGGRTRSARDGFGGPEERDRASPLSHCAASAATATGPGAENEFRRGSYCSAEAMTLALPYDPQWEDWVVTGCIDGVIRLWHLPTKQLLRTFSGHGDVVWGIAVLYGSSVMVSSSRDCTTKLWRLPPFSAMQAAVAQPQPLQRLAEEAVGGGVEAEPGGASITRAGSGMKTLDAMATLCGHTSAILCMDVHRLPPGVMPPAAAALRATAAATGAAAAAAAMDGSGAAEVAMGRARGSAGMTSYNDMVTVLSYLLNTGLVEPAEAAQGSAGGGGGWAMGGDGDSSGNGEDLLGTAAAAKIAAAGAAGNLPVWLVATGGADAVVRVWNLATAQCHTTLQGHSVGVLSVQFGYLPRHNETYRNQLLLPPNLDVTSAAAALPSLALPPGQYGSRGRPEQLPPSQRLVLVTGSVHEVRVWDPIGGTALAELSDHNGPVTSVALVHGAIVTLAMNDGLIVYKCNGLDGLTASAPSSYWSGGGSGSLGTGADGADGAASTGASLAVTTRPSSAVGRLRQEVASQRRVLEPVICLQDPHHHSFSAALAVQLEGVAVGSGTGDITYLDFRPRASPLPLLNTRRRPLL